MGSKVRPCGRWGTQGGFAAVMLSTHPQCSAQPSRCMSPPWGSAVPWVICWAQRWHLEGVGQLQPWDEPVSGAELCSGHGGVQGSQRWALRDVVMDIMGWVGLGDCRGIFRLE